MPVLTLENVGQLTDEQKQRLIKEFTATVAEVTGKRPESVYVRIDEVSPKNFGVGGKALG